ncbi:MAG: Gldg family protein [bacterium]
MKFKLKKPTLPKVTFVNSVNKAKSISWKLSSFTLVRILVLILVLFGINILSQRFFYRIDLTENKSYSLDKETKSLLGKLDDKVKLDVYMSSNMPSEFLPIRQNIVDLLNEYDRFGKGKITLDIKDPNKDSFKTDAAAAGLYEKPFLSRTADKTEVAQGYFGIALTYKETKDAIVFINENTIEYDLTSKINKLVNTDLPTVGFLTGHSEKSLDTDITQIGGYLKTQYKVVSVDFSAGQPLDASTVKALVIVDPQTEFSDRDLFELDQYLMQGGKVLVLGESYTNNLTSYTLTKNVTTKLNTFLQRYGLEETANVLMDESFTPVNGMITYPYWVLAQTDNINHQIPVLADLTAATFFWTSSVREFELGSNQKFTKLIQTTNYAWDLSDDTVNIYPQNFTVSKDRKQYTIAGMVDGSFTSFYQGKDIPALKTPSEDKRPKDFPRYDQSDKAKIILVGDSDFITDSFYTGNEQNPVLFINLIDWLSGNDALLGLRSKSIVTRPITPQSSAAKLAIRAVVTALVPLSVIAIGFGYNLYRRKKVSSIK